MLARLNLILAPTAGVRGRAVHAGYCPVRQVLSLEFVEVGGKAPVGTRIRLLLSTGAVLAVLDSARFFSENPRLTLARDRGKSFL